MFYFTADTHFGHEKIIRMCNRPFESVSEMDEKLIQNWNSRINGNDKVFVLGDMFFRSENAEEILKRLKGKKYLIIGNHDGSWTTKFDYSRYFADVSDYMEITDSNRAYVLCHYPLLTWKHEKKSFMIHGHIHNDTNLDFWHLIAARRNLLNAGTDINGFMPVTFEELLENNNRFKADNSGINE